MTPHNIPINFVSSFILLAFTHGPHRSPRRSRLPNHVTQRGNRRMTVFFSHDDYALTLDLLTGRCRKAGVEVRWYCLMPNHMHLILTPATPLALAATHTARCTGAPAA